MHEHEDLEKIVIDFKSPYGNSHIVVDNPDSTWPELIMEFCELLNKEKMGYNIPTDIVEKYLYNSIVPEKNKRLLEEGPDQPQQLELNLND